MEATIAHLSQMGIFSTLQPAELAQLQPHTKLTDYLQGEIILHEGDRLPSRLYTLAVGTIRVSKTAPTGKETILRMLTAGELFAAPALFGNGLAPATVTAETDCQVLTVEREALVNAIRETPEIAFRILSLFNQRLQQLHNTVHGLVSERAIARLVHYLQYCADYYGTEAVPQGDRLRMLLPYYQIARSIGVTYEECVRLFKQLQPLAAYDRGKITVQDWEKLAAIAEGKPE